jgi:hypothetical protein
MGLRSTQGDKKRLLSSNRSLMEAQSSPLSSRADPDFYYAAPEMATCAAFLEESRMKFADPTRLDRKSGAAESLR